MNPNRILFVDDEPNILKTIIRIFRNGKYEIFTAQDAFKGLELVKQKNIHVVFSDYLMPKKNGIEFLKEVRENSENTIRIILTAHKDLNVAVEAINEGLIYKFLLKPFDADQLMIEVRNAQDFFNLIQQRKALVNELEEKNISLSEVNNNLEKLVEDRTQQLIQSEKMATLGRLAAQIGHEINNVLVSLKARVEMMDLSDYDEGVINECKTEISYGINRLEIQAKNLLTLGRQKEPDYKELNIVQILENTIDNLNVSGILKFYKITRKYADHQHIINGDEHQINQVFTNILLNAHHAMNNTGEIKVGTKRIKEGKNVEVFISDEGYGISKENLEKIYEPFFTTKPQGIGSGLGMTVVKQIIDSHQGYLNVDSVLDHGTTVSIGFPGLK